MDEIYSAIPDSDFLLESHQDSCCIYLFKTKKTLMLEGIDSILFQFLLSHPQHDNASIDQYLKNQLALPFDSQLQQYIEASLQNLSTFGLLQT